MQESNEPIEELILDRANKSYKRDKGLNTPAFNAKVKKRRDKDKLAKNSKRANRGK